MTLKKYLSQAGFIGINTVAVFAIIDIAATSMIKTRGFSQFFESSTEAGFINKRNFNGIFGGPLNDFSTKVDINEFGTRKIPYNQCNPNENPRDRLIFVGDSMTAGFEVNDNQTYAAVFAGLNCKSLKVINGGVRAHDTHMAIANAFRISREMRPEENNTRSSIVYMATDNDFAENNNRTAYHTMKSKFGSFYDGKYYPPAKNNWENNTRMFVGDKMYFTTQAIVYFNIYKSYLQGRASTKNSISDDKCIRDSERALTIYKDTISREMEKETGKRKGKHIFYIGVHPSTTNFELTEKMEGCISQALRKKETFIHINLIPIHKFMREYNPSFVNNPSTRFRRDQHYSVFGHKHIANALNAILMIIQN